MVITRDINQYNAAQIVYYKASEVNTIDLSRLLGVCMYVQWDYKTLSNTVGELVRLN